MGSSRVPSSLVERFSHGWRLGLILAASAVVAIGLGVLLFTGPLFYHQTRLHVLFILSLTAFLVSVIQFIISVTDLDDKSPLEAVDDRSPDAAHLRNEGHAGQTR
jgi:hypothetical protein